MRLGKSEGNPAITGLSYFRQRDCTVPGSDGWDDFALDEEVKAV